MKKIRKKVVNCTKAAVLLAVLWFCLTETKLIGCAVAEALERCLTIIIPSLYIMMTAAVLTSKSGIMELIPKPFCRVGKYLFGMSGSVFAGFVFSMFAGYPVGARLLLEEYENGRITKKTAELLMGVCYGAGPAFVFGCISRELYSSPFTGRIIIISTVSANVITALLLSFFIRKDPATSAVRSEKKLLLNGQLVTDAVASGGSAMLNICFTIMAFAAVSAMLERCGAVTAAAGIFSRITGFSQETARGFAAAVLDITAAGRLPENNYALLPYLSALVSFGGVCVVFQLAAIVSGRLSMKPFFAVRAFACVMSFFICRLLMMFMLRYETVAVSTVNVRAHRAVSPIPSVMILIMTVMLMKEAGEE